MKSHKKPEWVEHYQMALSMPYIAAQMAANPIPFVARIEQQLQLLAIASAFFSMQKHTAQMSHLTDNLN